MENTKLTYLKDKSIAVKNGHKVSNELDDFFMWCAANKLTFRHAYMEDIDNRIVLSMGGTSITYFTIPEEIIPTKEDFLSNKSAAIKKIRDYIFSKAQAVEYAYESYAKDGSYHTTAYVEFRQADKDIEKYLDNKYKGE